MTISEATIGGDITHATLVVVRVLAGLHPDVITALPGVHFVVPAVVIQLDQAGEARVILVDDSVGVVWIKSLDLRLDAEITEVSSSGGELVDSAALLGWTNVILLVFETRDITEGLGGAITLWLLVYSIGGNSINVWCRCNGGGHIFIGFRLVDGALVVLSVYHGGGIVCTTIVVNRGSVARSHLVIIINDCLDAIEEKLSGLREGGKLHKCEKVLHASSLVLLFLL